MGSCLEMVAVAASLLSCLDLPTLRTCYTMMVQAGRQRTTLVNCEKLSKHLLSTKGIYSCINVPVDEVKRRGLP